MDTSQVFGTQNILSFIKIKTNGLIMDMMVLSVLDCLLIMDTTALLSQ